MIANHPTVGTMKSLVSLGRHYIRSRKPDKSFAGEFAHLLRIVKSLNLQSGYIVDIAAGDGVRQSSTLGFFKQPGWAGLAVEMDPQRFSKLAFLYSQFPNARLARVRITPPKIAALLEGFEVPHDFTILNLDIDSYDLHVMTSLLDAHFRPRIISMEINEKIPSPISFTVNFDDEHYWAGDHFYGCSATAASRAIRPYGYVLESIQYNNAFFVREDCAAGVIEDQDVDHAYRLGYLERGDRAELFKWNANVEHLLHCSTDDAMIQIRDLFEAYEGMYTLTCD